MTDDTTRAHIAPARFDQKCNPIDVGDKVRVRYAKTSDYWLAEVVAIEGDGMTVQWLGNVGPSESMKVPLGHVRTVGGDGGYGDGCSALGGVGSMKTDSKKRKWVAPQAMEEFECALNDVTKMVV